jgi:hypothetical protein
VESRAPGRCRSGELIRGCELLPGIRARWKPSLERPQPHTQTQFAPLGRRELRCVQRSPLVSACETGAETLQQHECRELGDLAFQVVERSGRHRLEQRQRLCRPSETRDLCAGASLRRKVGPCDLGRESARAFILSRPRLLSAGGPPIGRIRSVVQRYPRVWVMPSASISVSTSRSACSQSSIAFPCCPPRAS